MKRLPHSLILILCLWLLLGCTLRPEALVVAPTATQEARATPRPSATAIAATMTATPTMTTPTATTTTTPTAIPLDPTPTLAPLSREERKAIFERTWTIVRDRYVYDDYRGVDWDALRLEFTPRIVAAEEPETFYELMRELIDRLGDDHSRFESPQQVASQQAEFRGELRYGGIGALIRTVDEGGLILMLAPGAPAERAGLQARDLILAVNGKPFIDEDAFGPEGPIGEVRGEPGTFVRLTVRSGDDPPRDLEVVREAVASDAFNRVRGHLLPGGHVGVVEIPSFYVDALDVRTREAVEELLAAGTMRGLIIDVRGNSGGYVHLMRNTVALFHDGGSIGSTSGRASREEQQIPAGQTIPAMADIPIAILIGPNTVSAGEMFAAGMQVLGRARIVGEPSAGNTENLFGYNFDDGSRLLLAELAYHLPDGTMIEERGVIPDRQVGGEWWRLPPDEDPQLLAAVEELGLVSGIGDERKN
ncbi:MAG: peptidase S41 [Candidatus Viridilinea halotolerans]|uniref:Peptidase S41 n=1 Tax=Candidatus Viridilinea halotolerans TaxID=2491704 RepID=A0A426U3Z5_9CHLR|nr:MAG: peptidase S41 [Candidatus Viridilinea halotolerans]